MHLTSKHLHLMYWHAMLSYMSCVIHAVMHDDSHESFVLLAAGTTLSTASAAVITSGQAGKQSQESAQVVELDADELHTYKRRLVDLLQPQETVLAALRRLGGLHGTTHAGSDALPWKRARKAAGVQSCVGQPLFCDAFACNFEHNKCFLSPYANH